MNYNRTKEFIKNPRKALLVLAMPILVAMVVQSLYTIVDTAFVGRLGAEAIAALTFAFPIFFILIALNAGLGIGTSSLISRYLGSKKKAKAENTAMHGLVFSVVLGVIVFVLGNVFLSGLLHLFGATETVVQLAEGYMRIVLAGSFFMFLAFMMNSIFSAQGDTKTPMKIQVTALVLNIILDPIFIYTFGWGVNGAAVATVGAFITSFILYVIIINKRSYLKLSFKKYKFSKVIFKQIIKVGFPASLMMLFMAFYSIFINKYMSIFGTDYVAALGMVARIESLTVMPIVAFSMALVTLTGMFMGAKRYDLLKDSVMYSLFLTVGVSLGMGVLFFFIPQIVMRIFTSEANLIMLASNYVKIHIWSFPFIAIGLVCSRAMQGMGYGFPALVINLVRVLFLVIPLGYLFIFVLGYGYLSIAVAVIIGAFVSSIVALVWFLIKVKKLNGN